MKLFIFAFTPSNIPKIYKKTCQNENLFHGHN